jgi:hypothetical protein
VASTSLTSQGSRYFFWTAPPVGSGIVTAYYGVVDGDCMMDSLNDDARAKSFLISEGT